MRRSEQFLIKFPAPTLLASQYKIYPQHNFRNMLVIQISQEIFEVLHKAETVIKGYPKPWIAMGHFHAISWNSVLIYSHYKKAHHS